VPDALRFPLVLGLVCAVSGASLAVVYNATHERIKRSERRKLAAAFEDIEGYASFEEKKTEGYYRLLDASGALVGLATEVECPGSYNSTEPVKLVVVADPSAERVLYVGVTRCSETPGFGARVVESPPVNTWGGKLSRRPDEERKRPPFQAGLSGAEGRTAGELALEADGGAVPIDGMTGATITARAVTRGTRLGLEKLKSVRAPAAPAAITGATGKHENR